MFCYEGKTLRKFNLNQVLEILFLFFLSSISWFFSFIESLFIEKNIPKPYFPLVFPFFSFQISDWHEFLIRQTHIRNLYYMSKNEKLLCFKMSIFKVGTFRWENSNFSTNVIICIVIITLKYVVIIGSKKSFKLHIYRSV